MFKVKAKGTALIAALLYCFAFLSCVISAAAENEGEYHIFFSDTAQSSNAVTFAAMSYQKSSDGKGIKLSFDIECSGEFTDDSGILLKISHDVSADTLRLTRSGAVRTNDEFSELSHSFDVLYGYNNPHTTLKVTADFIFSKKISEEKLVLEIIFIDVYGKSSKTVYFRPKSDVDPSSTASDTGNSEKQTDKTSEKASGSKKPTDPENKKSTAERTDTSTKWKYDPDKYTFKNENADNSAEISSPANAENFSDAENGSAPTFDSKKLIGVLSAALLLSAAAIIAVFGAKKGTAPKLNPDYEKQDKNAENDVSEDVKMNSEEETDEQEN